MARRVGTLDPVIAELRSELRDRLPAGPAVPHRDIDRRRQVRVAISLDAVLRVGVLSVPGVVQDESGGGLFLSASVRVESGERGQIELEGMDPVAVRVAWTRGSAHPLGQGIGLIFEVRDMKEERRVLELVLAMLDRGVSGA